MHMETPWNYEQNQFDNATKRSNALMLVLSSDHLSKLKAQPAEPEIVALAVRTEPLHQVFVQHYIGWKNAKAARKSGTFQVEQMLGELSGSKIKQWDIQIQGQHLEGTAQYMNLLPDRRGPFQTGAIEQRIDEVEALGVRLQGYPMLAATKADVDLFKNALLSARDQQQQDEHRIAFASTDVEKARKDVATIMYGNLGVLMDKYREMPERLATFWEVSLMQHGSSSREFAGQINAATTVQLTKTVGPNAKLVLSNTGYTPLYFCLAMLVDDPCTGTVSLDPGQVLELDRADLGAANAAFLNVTNPSADTAGSYDVEVIG